MIAKKITKKMYEKEKALAIQKLNKQITFNKKFVDDLFKETGRLRPTDINQIISDITPFLRSDDPRMNQAVVITHEDGSHFFINHAWYVEFFDKNRTVQSNINDDVIVVFSEHNGTLFFYVSDLTYYSIVAPVP